MQIYSFSKLIAIPFAAAFAFLLYKSLTDPYFQQDLWMFPPLTVCVLIYLFSPQIDHWWLESHPIKLDDEIKSLLTKLNPRYAAMDSEEKNEFENRVGLYINGREFTAMGREKESVPYDFQAMIAQVAVDISFHEKDYLIGDYDRIIIYKHPFHTPRYQFLHAMETHAEDGVILFSLEHFQAAINKPNEFYPVGHHAYAEAYINQNPTIDWPVVPDVTWEKLELISNFKKDKVLESIGFERIDLLPMCIAYYFVFNQKFRKELPEYTTIFDSIFNRKISS